MYFKDVVGQDDIKQQLINDVNSGTIAHALLFCGPEGVGKLQSAIAFASYILCKNHADTDSCGVCPSCTKIKKLIHPDLHFVFPVINKSTSGSKKTISDDEISTWRQTILDKGYFSYEDWLAELSANNKQAMIYTSESESIVEKLSLMSTEGGYKIMIIWHPEKMHETCANSLLKLIEEPPAKTLFILVSDSPDQILGTIVSRTQRIDFKPLSEQIIFNKLIGPEYLIESQQAKTIAHISGGSWLKAKQTLQINESSREYLDYFIQLMRLTYARKLKELKVVDEDLADKGREWQKRFLSYCLRMSRENFILNFHQQELNYMTAEESQFSTKFAPFVNEKNIIGLMDEFSLAYRHIEQNVNAKMVFFDISLKIILLLNKAR